MTKILILFVIIIIISGEIICEYQLIEKFNNINPNTLINLNKFYSNTKSISLECKQLKNETLLQYTHGKRITGDQLIAHSTIDKQFLNSIQDKEIILTYEQNNTGPILSYLKIIVDQDSQIGSAYVYGEENIIYVIIKCLKITKFSYDIKFYGYKNINNEKN